MLLPARDAKTEQSSAVLALIQPGELAKKEVVSVKPVKEESPDEKNTDSSVEETVPAISAVSDKKVTIEQNVVASDVSSEIKAEEILQPEDENLTDEESGDKQ